MDSVHDTGDDSPHESTRLLADSSSSSTKSTPGATSTTSSTLAEDDDQRPLPLGQLACVCFARLLEPIAYFSIFPFISQMVVDVGHVEEADIGFYSGLIESLFSVAQMVSMIFWGRASDRYGRRPVLLLSLVGETISVTLFGFSSHLWQMILLRCTAGLFSGTLVTLRTITSEISTPQTAARAYSWFSLLGNTGILLGSALGGALARPADLYPGVFGGIQFFHEKPYALVTICTGTLAASILLVSSIFVKETLSRTPDHLTAARQPQPPMSIWQIVTSPGMSNILLIHALIMMISFAYSAILPVFWYLRPTLGGYGFSPAFISIGIMTIGTLQAFISLVLFSPLQRRFGSARILQIASGVFPIFYAITPVTSLALRAGYTEIFWVLAVGIQIVYSLATMAPVSIQLLLNAASPTVAPAPSQTSSPPTATFTGSDVHENDNESAVASPSPSPRTTSTTTLGTTNSIALSIQSFIRIISPVTFSSLFALSVKKNLIGGYLVWIVLAGLSVGCWGATLSLRTSGPQVEEYEGKKQSKRREVEV